MKNNLPPSKWYQASDLGPDRIRKFDELMAPINSWLPSELTNFRFGLQYDYLASLIRIGLLKHESNFNYYCVVAFAAAMVNSDPDIVSTSVFRKYLREIIVACIDRKKITSLDALYGTVIRQASLIKPTLNSSR